MGKVAERVREIIFFHLTNMCGRFSITHPWNELATFFQAQGQPDPPFPPRYNVAPGQPILVLRAASDDSRHPALLRWGLIPSWAKEEKIGWVIIESQPNIQKNC